MDEDYFVCPHCGAELSVDATFCRHCGASEDAGWGGEADSSDADQSDDWSDDFDYDDFIAREFPEHARTPARRRNAYWLAFAVVALLCILLMLMGLF